VKVNGPPSNKFVYYIVANHGPIDQSSIMDMTGINRKTLQTSLEELIETGLIKANPDRRDMRRRIYSLNTGLQ
jgi:DNA-binding MarR family transcriptional regulator